MTQMSEAEREDIWAEGHEAFEMDEPEHSNPYRLGTLEYEIWLDGWEDVQQDN
ncbi:hypothetical protein [Marinobacter lutaoensis]|uniref:hypothetical protein n=1 Tax=Marinobacter lutaoensis TaxID=135739 RepID=UPI00158854EC|nr:hypothetical protein [Marinobacter lutaoensis]